MVDSYKHIFYELGDPRTKDWFMVSGPGLLFGLAVFYINFCTSFGFRYMEHRKPYDLKRCVMLYNIVQILFSIFLFNEGIQLMAAGFTFHCQPVDYSTNPTAIRSAAATWWYFFAKVTELLDTIFFILRKKNNQVSFLHVYHHTIMLAGMWIGVKYFPGGHQILMGTLNSFVHIVMYTYYFISGLGPEYQKYLWWKKYLTVLQLVQFVIIAYQNIYPLFNDCPYPKILNILMSVNSILFIYLFGKFYVQNYGKLLKRRQNGSSTTNGTSEMKKIN